ncbi:hypothetical protein EUTSA_v10023545mg [Eutrema salsugineum]|uniref:Hydroxyproline-rich glycoprotein family protein n=1 Tax=Eutrema salsugineum TaxID=72664 RepID=V4KNV0_EUTSA|nr:uncharacterized protein At1g76660 [Eutrema salsugineum]ESQ29003.1 hypothetical protein EUTSA_v10023545mg [Eutrema salsugineum]
MRGGASGNNVMETINAAATAIASSDDRVRQASPIRKKRKWWNRWSLFICFRPSRQRKRIGKAALAPEPVQISTADSTSNPSGYRSVITALPFIAPPSSPASFFQSEPPSATQSPVGILSFSPLPNNNNNRPWIFAIGPYAHETQLVSPPVFSTYTTEPSSAPITPPLDESIYFTTTTPSSPEVPFAQLFNSNFHNNNYGHRSPISNYEFQFYQLPPGSPLGQLISPSSVVSGSGPTSPFPERFPISDPPKLLSPDKLHCSESVTTTPKVEEQKIVRPHKPVSFDLDADHVIRCVDQKLRTTFPEAAASCDQEETQDSSLGSNKEFNFGTDEKHLTIEEHRASTKNSNDWSFFPVMQSGTLS